MKIKKEVEICCPYCGNKESVGKKIEWLAWICEDSGAVWETEISLKYKVQYYPEEGINEMV